jgi:Glyoxalase-like domain
VVAEALGDGGLERLARRTNARGEAPSLRYVLLTLTEEYALQNGHADRLPPARQISAVARELGFPADPSAVQTVQVSIDALVGSEVLPFWRAVLGYEYRGDSPDEDLIDPGGRGAPFWFQQMDAPRPQRNRIHIDDWVPHDQAEARVAGGDRRRRPPGDRPARAVVVDAGRRRGQRGRRGHLDGQRLSESSRQRMVTSFRSCADGTRSSVQSR